MWMETLPECWFLLWQPIWPYHTTSPLSWQESKFSWQAYSGRRKTNQTQTKWKKKPWNQLLWVQYWQNSCHFNPISQHRQLAAMFIPHQGCVAWAGTDTAPTCGLPHLDHGSRATERLPEPHGAGKAAVAPRLAAETITTLGQWKQKLAQLPCSPACRFPYLTERDSARKLWKDLAFRCIFKRLHRNALTFVS